MVAAHWEAEAGSWWWGLEEAAGLLLVIHILLCTLPVGFSGTHWLKCLLASKCFSLFVGKVEVVITEASMEEYKDQITGIKTPLRTESKDINTVNGKH